MNASVGQTEEEKLNVDILLEYAMDYRNVIVRLAYNPEYVGSPFSWSITLYKHLHYPISGGGKLKVAFALTLLMSGLV